MPGIVKHLVRTTVKLEEPIVRLAEALARECGVTVPELLEALVLGCSVVAEDGAAPDRDGAGEDGAPSLPAARLQSPPVVRRKRRRGPAKILSLSAARLRRRLNSLRGHDAPSLGERVTALCDQARALRERARAACLAAEHARRSARTIMYPTGGGRPAGRARRVG